MLAVDSSFILTYNHLQDAHSISQSNKILCDKFTTPTMQNLPDDILILVFSSCDVETLFALRLTCASFSAVIQAYIKTIAPSSARATFLGCNQLLAAPPEDGYSLHWLRNLVPAQLASIVLDKDKLRRYSYINSGFPYGIPSESSCAEAQYWRQRIANGWRVLRAFHLISARVYASYDEKFERHNAFRKVGDGVRTSRIWQAVSCPYADCTEHGMKNLFVVKHHRDSHNSHCGEREKPKDLIRDIRRKESQVLRSRLAHMKTLSDQDLLDYAYLWRLLLHLFRPYSRPETTVWDSTERWTSSSPIPRPSWSTIISDIAQGCSWLNWFVLYVGTAPFQQQWSLNISQSNSAIDDVIRNSVWKAWNARSTHQIEIEREYVSKFEFILRKRCLSSERLKRLEAEISRGRSINTISLDCIPWIYDQHHKIPRPPADFPWYEPDQLVYLSGDMGLNCTPGTSWSQPGVLKRSLVRCKGGVRNPDSDVILWIEEENDKGPLGQLPYLVYLGVEEAGKLWPGSIGDGPELAL